MRFLLSAFLVCLLIIALPASLDAQFLPENHYIGPSIGFSFLGSVPEFGANYEYGMEIEGLGLVGIGGVFRYWSYRTTWWSYTNIIVGAQGNYQFDIDNEKISPFAGLVLAWYGGSINWRGTGERLVTPTHGGLYLAAQGGVRYWVSPSMGLVARLGYGSLSYGALTLGVDFRL